MGRMTFSRRALLTHLATIPLTAGLARTLFAQSVAKGGGVGPMAPKRLVIFMQNNGTKRCNFWPSRPSGNADAYAITSTPILNALFTNDGVTDNGLKAKTNLIRGLQVTNDVSMTGNQHDIGFARMFTGAKLMPTADGSPWGGAASIDQILAREWNVQSVTTAVYASSVEPHPKQGFDHRSSFSYVAPQTLNLPIIDPLTVYANTFPQTDKAVVQRLVSRKSVLDAVNGDLKEIAGRLGPDDHRKLDFHLSAVRDAETRLSSLIENHPICAYSPSAPQDFRSLSPGFANNEVNIETFVPDMLNAMVTLIGAALKCGLTRVGSLQLGYCGGKWMWGWRNINLEHHGDIAHHDTIDDVGTSDDQIATTNRVTTINRFYADLVRRLALDLASAPEGAGNMLDNTLIVWANEMGRGDHQLDDIPIVLVGLVGNGVSQGGRVLDAAAPRGGAQQPHNVLGYHVLNALGHPVTGFGDIADMRPYALSGF